MVLAYKREQKTTKKGHEFLKFVKEKGNAPMVHNDTSSCANTHVTHVKNVKNAHNAYSSHAMVTSTSHTSFVKATHARSRQLVHHAKFIHAKDDHVHAKKKIASKGPFISYHTFDVSYVSSCKSNEVVASHVGPKRENGKTCVWVPKNYVTNLKVPNSDWVPKTKA
jgi:hypothetical protein